MAAPKKRRARGRPQGGSEALVRTILKATREELGTHGFAKFRVERIAAAAKVNKTSIYRRWPSKSELVLAAISKAEDEPTFTPTGDLRADLVALMTQKLAGISTPKGRRVMRALMAFEDAEVAAFTRSLRELRYLAPRALVIAAIESGALPANTDAVFLTELLFAPVLHRLLVTNEPVDAAFVARVVDHVLAGAQ